ncbi:hypothetical protein EAO27_18600 [Sphingopyxis sp. YF1]|nr:hypothetical protein EAO27_18600 [Sphingopyxis sp. YF1]
MGGDASDLARWIKAFRAQLSLADDEKVLRAVWSVNAIQSGDANVDGALLWDVPKDLEPGKMFSKRSIYPWELDTLANELLTIPKHDFYRTFNCRSWRSLADIVNLLRNIENAEYGARRHVTSMYVEMGRIAARQFDWQRGFFNVPDLYRSAFIYGQGACAQHLADTYGLNINDLTFTGYALMAMYVDAPECAPMGDLSELAHFGLPIASFQKVLSRISLPIDDIRAKASRLRQPEQQTAYRPSILRRYPCVVFGRKRNRMIAPIPDLIAYRLTAGLFFDIVGGTGSVRNDCGKHFEAYSLSLLSKMLPEARFEPEWRYKVGRNHRDTSDIILFDGLGNVLLAIECKARWMGAEVRFGEKPNVEKDYDEIISGVYQAWRFFSDCRRGLTGRSASPKAIGLVLALDEWFAARSAALDRVIAEAHARADANGDILAEDRRPIAFCSIHELETVLKTATEESLLGALDDLASKPKGWIFSSLHSDFDAPKTSCKPYPFHADLFEMLPWYQRISMAAEDGRGWRGHSE